MSYLGWFDGELRPDAWFDAELQPAAWFDTEIVNTSTAGNTAVNLGVGSLSITGYAPTVTQALSVGYSFAVIHEYRDNGSISVTSWIPLNHLTAQGANASYVVRGSQGINSWSYVVPSASGVVDTPINPGVGSITFTGYAPTIAQGANQSILPAVGSLTIMGYAPTLAQTANQSVLPSAGSLAITGYAPTLAQSVNQAVAPGAGSLTIAGYAPTLAQTANQAVAPGVGSLTVTGYAPTIAQGANQSIAPGVGSLVLTGYAPTLAQTTNQTLIPGVGSLTFTGYAPAVAQSTSGSYGVVHNYVNRGSVSIISWLNDGLGADPNAIHPGTGSLTITGYAPTVTRTTASSYGVAHSYVTRGSQSVVGWLNDGLGVDPGAITPGAGTLAITGYAPTLVQTTNQGVVPGAGTLTITGYAPTLVQTTNQAVAPGVGNLTITGYAPIVTRTANQSISPSVGNITITGHAPTLAQTANQALAPGTGSLTITGHAPTLVQTANQGVIPGTGSLAITGYAPVVAQAPGSYVVSAARANLIYEIALLHGLVPSNPLMVSDTLRSAGSVIQTISTVGTSVTITTVSSDVIQGDLDTWIDALAAVHGLTTPLVVTEASRNAGAIHQTMSNDGTTTTVETP